VTRTVAVSPRQAAVITELLTDGAGNHTIGNRLGIAAVTVGNHMHAVMRAAGMPTRTALALAVERRQLELRVTARPTTENR
jgi:DNA-binding NarL/FixJ family response regulator